MHKFEIIIQKENDYIIYSIRYLDECKLHVSYEIYFNY